MSNSMRGAVAFEAEGVSYHLRLTTNAQVRYQDKMGESLLDAFLGMDKDLTNMKRLRGLFWAGLSHMPEMTEDMAGDLIDELGLGEVGSLIGRAVEAAFPAPKAGDAPAGASGSAEGNGKGTATSKTKPPTT